MSARAAPEFIPGCDQETARRVIEATFLHGSDQSSIRYVSSPCGFLVVTGVRDVYADRLDLPAPHGPICGYANPCFTDQCNQSDPSPTITAVTPNTADMAGGSVHTITGTGFRETADVYVGGAMQTNRTFVSDTEIQFTLLPQLKIGPVNVLVSMGGGVFGGGYTNKFPMTITGPPPPTITTLTPSSAVNGTSASITVTGTGFTPDAQILLSGTPIPTTFIDANTVAMSSTVTNNGNPMSVPVSVRNGPFPAAPSNELPFTWTAPPRPTITSLTPNTAPANGATVTVTVVGANYGPSSVVRTGGVTTPTTYISPTQLTFTHASLSVFEVDITVRYAGVGSGESDEVPFTWTAPV